MHARDARGIATVEFALAAPMLFLLVLATAEFGRAFVEYTVLSYAVRDAVRYVSENSINGTTGVVSLNATTIANAQNLVVYDNVAGTGTARLTGLKIGQVAVTAPGANNIQVAVSYPYTPMVGSKLPTFGFGAPIPLTFNMAITVTMRAIT